MTDTELRCPTCAAAAAAPAYSIFVSDLTTPCRSLADPQGRSPPTPSRRPWWRCSAKTPAGAGPQLRGAQVRSRGQALPLLLHRRHACSGSPGRWRTTPETRRTHRPRENTRSQKQLFLDLKRRGFSRSPTVCLVSGMSRKLAENGSVAAWIGIPGPKARCSSAGRLWLVGRCCD
jgi:hypothetical protein